MACYVGKSVIHSYKSPSRLVSDLSGREILFYDSHWKHGYGLQQVVLVFGPWVPTGPFLEQLPLRCSERRKRLRTRSQQTGRSLGLKFCCVPLPTRNSKLQLDVLHGLVNVSVSIMPTPLFRANGRASTKETPKERTPKARITTNDPRRKLNNVTQCLDE